MLARPGSPTRAATSAMFTPVVMARRLARRALDRIFEHFGSDQSIRNPWSDRVLDKIKIDVKDNRAWVVA